MLPLPAPLRTIVDFALPPRCPSCGAIVEDDHRFCPACWSALQFFGGPSCSACGVPFAFDRGVDARCGACLQAPPAHDGVRAIVAYGAVARTVVLRLKHGRRPAMAHVIARHLEGAAKAEPDALIAPVPLHRWRIWSRGFNQSALVAGALARSTGHAVTLDLVKRRKPTPMLGGLGRRERARTMRGVFGVAAEHRATIAGRTILLVDDVYTSGATANACAKVLKRAGAARVLVLCWARVLLDEDGSEH